MIIGCYTLDLYCDYPSHTRAHGEFSGSPQGQYTDEYGSRCRAEARRDGWILRSDGTAICPRCAKESNTILDGSDPPNNGLGGSYQPNCQPC